MPVHPGTMPVPGKMPLEAFFARTDGDPMTQAFPDIPAIGHGGAVMGAMGRGGAKPDLPAAPQGGFADWAPEAFSAAAAVVPEAPFSLYLHVPYCSHRCSFCPFYINAGRAGFSAPYAALLSREIAGTARVLAPYFGRRKVRTVFFGGGTPSDLDLEDMSALLRQLRDQFPITDETEITVEGRVRGFTAAKAAAWVGAGANRFSIGVQSTDTTLRRRMGRLATREEVREVFEGLVASGAVAILDLIYGLPGQSPEMLAEDVRFVAEETGAHGLDLYELKQFPGSPMAAAIANGRLPAAADRAGRGRMFAAGTAALAQHGFSHFTRKHWRRSTRERSLYNRTAQGPHDLLAFGSGAGGRIGRFSFSMERDIARYEAAVLAGEKPVANVQPTPPPSPFRTALSECVEACALPKVEHFPEGARAEARIVLDQWRDAGLLTTTPREHCPTPSTAGLHMTLPGTFWAEHLQRLLVQLCAGK